MRHAFGQALTVQQMVSHLTFECFARGEEFVIGLMARSCAKQAKILLLERQFQIDMRLVDPAKKELCFMARHLHFGLVCPKKK